MKFDLTDLKLFVHVHESGTITQGAVRAHMTLASASERIRGMEDTLGVPLLTRSRRGVDLTPAGQTLLHHARMVLNQVDRMRGDLSDYGRGLKGHVRLLSNTSAMTEHLPGLLPPFLLDNPLISVDLEERSSHDIADSLRAGVCDMGIAAYSPAFDGLTTYPFRADILVCVIPKQHALSGRKKVTLSELASLSFVGLPQHSALETHVAHHARQVGRTLSYRIRLGSFESICHFVGQGVGVAIVPRSAALRYGRRAGTQYVTLDDAWSTRQLVFAVRQPTALPAHAAKLMQHLLSKAVS